MVILSSQVIEIIFQDTDLSVEDGQFDKTSFSKLGNITVSIYRVRPLDESTNAGRNFHINDKLDQGIVNEKAKKALLTHSVKYAFQISASGLL